MKTIRPLAYRDAILFACEHLCGSEVEYCAGDLNLHVLPAPARRPDFAGQVYLEAFERVRGGVTFLNAWMPATPRGVMKFFRWLEERKTEFVSARPYRLGQACDGTIGSPVLHAFTVACDALGLDADRLYKSAYPERDDNPPDWNACRRHAEWQGGVVWPKAWDAAAVAGVAESLTEINYHRLRGEFEDVAEAVLRGKAVSANMRVTTRQRANRAITLLKALARARLRGGDLILPDGSVFNEREYDACFEMGDGEEVVVLIMLAHRIDAELRRAFGSSYARERVDAPGWARTLAAWEAKQPRELPLE